MPPRKQLLKSLSNAAGISFTRTKRMNAQWIDESVGALIRQLQAKGHYENTVIIFVTDQGVTNFGKFGKDSPYNSSVAIPMIIHWKSAITSGIACGPLHLQNGEGPLPDVFSDHFASFLTTRVEEVVAEHKDSRNLLGFFSTDIPDWELPKYARKQEDEYVMIFPWLNALMKLGVTSPGKQRWIEHLKSRYDSAEDAARVWGFMDPFEKYYTSWTNVIRETNAAAPRLHESSANNP